MRIIYIVYREDNTLVFNSQVLEYLKLLEKNYNVDLILFRNHETFFKKTLVEKKISNYVKNYITLPSLPLFFRFQLDINVLRLKFKVLTKFKLEDPTFIMCRGELATYIASKTFKGLKNKLVLYDNRGLPIEELVMKNKKNIIYKLNKRVKEKTIIYSKDNCDIYSFVTNNLREYLTKSYGYVKEKKYYIIPTLTNIQDIDNKIFNEVKEEIEYDNENFYVTYIGSTATWQSIDKIFEVYSQIKYNISNAKLVILTNGDIIIPNTFPEEFKKSIITKAVKHDLVKYYLKCSDIGLVIRDENIVNKVSAPTKISEYISFDVPILYKGEIGVLDDLHNIRDNGYLIRIDNNDWIEQVKDINRKNIKDMRITPYKAYFDMQTNQNKLIEEIKTLLMDTSYI